jgi:hypothetical protein
LTRPRTFAIYFRLGKTEMKKHLLYLAALLLGVTAAAAQKLESLGEPCRAKQILAGKDGDLYSGFVRPRSFVSTDPRSYLVDALDIRRLT